MGIVDEDVVRVREATDIVALVSEHLALRKVGRRWQGLCPFHAEKSPSFSVNPELGLYYCFGCHAKGDAITFVRDIEHLDFAGAVEHLSKRAGITLRYTDRGEGEGRKKRSGLIDAVAAAVEWYHERLLSAGDAARARSYLRSRGIDGDTARSYRLGWAPDGWDELTRALPLPDQVLVDAGLAFRNRRNRLTDQFRGRVLFPIFDAQGDPVGFGGRVLPGGDGPKYKNSPETAIYEKGKVLYGLNWHKAEIVEAGEVVVCEGYTDVIGFASAGVARAVATCGTALTEEHVRMLKRFANRVVLSFDADVAGQAAAERFYEWESKYEVDVAVAELPDGVDPGDLAQSDPEMLRRAVEDARPFLGFRVHRVLASGSLGSPEGRARAAKAALAAVSEHPDPLVRDQYLMEIADRCQIDPAQLRRDPSGGAVVADVSSPRDARRVTPAMEALRVAVHEPGSVAAFLDEVLFEDPVELAAYRALAGAHTLHEALESADPGAAELLQQLAVEEAEADPADVVARLVDEAVAREIVRLEGRARRSEDPLRFAADMAEAKLLVERLREPSTSLDAAGQLVGWLRDKAEGSDD